MSLSTGPRAASQKIRWRFGGEAAVLVDFFERGACAIGIEADERAGQAQILVPALAHSSLDGHARRHGWRQHFVAIGSRLRVEKFERWEADNAAADALGNKLLVCCGGGGQNWNGRGPSSPPRPRRCGDS